MPKDFLLLQKTFWSLKNHYQHLNLKAFNERKRKKETNAPRPHQTQQNPQIFHENHHHRVYTPMAIGFFFFFFTVVFVSQT